MLKLIEVKASGGNIGWVQILWDRLCCTLPPMHPPESSKESLYVARTPDTDNPPFLNISSVSEGASPSFFELRLNHDKTRGEKFILFYYIIGAGATESRGAESKMIQL